MYMKNACILITIVIIIGAVAFVFSKTPVKNMMMMTADQTVTQNQFVQTKTNQAMTVTVQITATATNAFSGILLLEKSETVYTKTDTAVRAQWDPKQTQVMMAPARDISKGGVVLVQGVKQANGVITATKIVILTKAVQVQ